MNVNVNYGDGAELDGVCFFFSSRRRHTRYIGDWSSDVCSSDLRVTGGEGEDREENEADPDEDRDRDQRASDQVFRSEERRVGKECRSRWSRYHKKIKVQE